MLVIVSNINYDFTDTEGYDENTIPKTWIVEVDDIDDAIDEVSNITGLCVNDADCETISFEKCMNTVFEKLAGKTIQINDGISIPELGIEKATINFVMSKLFS